MMLSLLVAAMVGSSPAPVVFADHHQIGRGPNVEVWTNHDEVFRRGEQARVYFRATESGYVTVFRIDTDGRMRVLYPREPWEDNYARAGQQYEVRSYGDRYAFPVDDYPGEGYIFAVVSADPFNYGSLVRGDHWDYRVITADGGRVTGDPYVALTDLVDRIVPPNYEEYSYDVLPYYVDQHYDYPRFLCYDCHTYASYSYWNPYSYSCFRFRIVMYDDYYYYPNRRFAGARVVYRSAPRLAPRYVFKDRGGSDQPFVTTVRQRPVDPNGRRVVDVGVTSRDLGGTGRVATPVTNGRQRPGSSGDLSGGTDRRRPVDGNSGQPVGGRSADPRAATENGHGQVIDPRQPPRRGNEGSGAQSPAPNTDAGRRADPSVTPRPSDGRQQPQLERRDPRRGEVEMQGQPQRGTRPDQQQNDQPRNTVQEQPRRVVVPDRAQVEQSRQPERGSEPRPEPRSAPPAEPRQAAPREQPRAEPPREQPRSEPRRAEPRTEPRRAPAQKPQDSNNESSTRRRG